MKANQHTLAIVIPAYKAKYITDTLSSLAAQTCKSFKVYIGNDGGNSEIDDIVKSFEAELDLTYIYFDKNLGSTSLVKAWQRCIALTNNEPWLWVLPDDDFVSEDCVATFYRLINNSSNFDLYRFNSAVTNDTGKIQRENNQFPDVEPAFVSLMEKVSYRRTSTLAEYIFSREAYSKNGGFPELPLAWGSDDAAWYLFGNEKGIKNIAGGKVYLRQSAFNISGNYKLQGKLKLEALVGLFAKLAEVAQFQRDVDLYKSHYNFEALSQFFVFNEFKQLRLSLSLDEIVKLGYTASKFWSGGVLKNCYRFWINNNKLRK